ncbi:hypothetical protein BCR35DRAFT_352483 [Leucosporidium creatinivorum]|uniref:D-isomer specific 2-hydroxyacid dehydrogenase NAD-binding domain-containing protein n=1 Tax=Leucosporidium creatinivorum TaxID=106004 RepID=A0A1Y2F9W6_9BASI|nr:hypothetical protein BCR35DRAFT_352483 [Leucosporidium creatinivorum]
MPPTPLTSIRTLLVLYPLQPASLLPRLRSIFPTVHFYPGPAGNDYSATVYPEPPDEVWREADAILCFGLPKGLKEVGQTPRLKLLQVVGSGTRQITDTPFYQSVPKDHPLILANSAGIHGGPIGEHVLMTTMMLLHKMQPIADITRGEKRWAAPQELGGLFVQELRGLTVGILGYGHIGREIARLSTAFGSRIIACTRTGVKASIGGYHLPGTGDPAGDLPPNGIPPPRKPACMSFLQECDVVVNMLPSSEGNRGFVGKEEFGVMKDTALFINPGRGDTIDQEALVSALQASLEATEPPTGLGGSLRIAGASLDVTNPEPLPPNHILFSLPNAIITPHCSWASKDNFVRAVDLLEENANRLEKGLGALNALRGRGEFDE